MGDMYKLAKEAFDKMGGKSSTQRWVESSKSLIEAVWKTLWMLG